MAFVVLCKREYALYFGSDILERPTSAVPRIGMGGTVKSQYSL